MEALKLSVTMAAEDPRRTFQSDAELSCPANGAHISNVTRLSNRESHQMLWDSIFGDYKWLNDIVEDFGANPILVGTRLKSKSGYMVLLSGDISGDVTYTKDFFFSSLKPHKYIECTGEIILNCGITLNIADILHCPETIPVDIQKLLCDRDEPRSTYSFWKDPDCALRVLEPPSLALTKSRIPGNDECFWISRFVSDRGNSDFEVWFEHRATVSQSYT
jgi:hypothetical protein